MVQGRLKSRSFRRIYKRTPGGNLKLFFELRKPSKHICGRCGIVLKGVANDRPVKLRNMPKTMKRPARAFGGILCSKCSRAALIEKASKESSGPQPAIEH